MIKVKILVGLIMKIIYKLYISINNTIENKILIIKKNLIQFNLVLDWNLIKIEIKKYIFNNHLTVNF